MTQEQKDLLLKDLCARLPYVVMCEYTFMDGRKTDMVFKGKHFDHEVICKPYLRPMSSMTDEERDEYRKISNTGCAGVIQYGYTPTQISVPSYEKIDWLNAHHFDYRGLIDKGLAIEAPQGMYNN